MHYTRRAKRLIVGFSVLGLVLAFVVLGSFRFSAAVKDKERYERERSAMREPEPNIVEIQTESRPQVRRYAADLWPWAVADVPAEVAGRVVAVLVEAGDPVELGQQLVRLDDTMARIGVERAAARHEEVVRLATEAASLVKTRAISETQYRAAAAEARVAAAELAEAREIFERQTVVAPFNGVVNRRFVDVGDAVNVNEAVAEVIDLSRLRVVFFVSENDVAAFPEGKTISLMIPARPDLKLEPKVEFASKSADPATRLYRIEAVLPNAEVGLPGGLQGVVSTEVDRFADMPFVPAMAVRFSGRKSLVWRLDSEGAPEQVEISVGPEIDGSYPVFSGLQAGDRIIIR